MAEYPGPDVPKPPPTDHRVVWGTWWEVGFNWKAAGFAVMLGVAVSSLEWWRIALIWGAVYGLREVWRNG